MESKQDREDIIKDNLESKMDLERIWECPLFDIVNTANPKFTNQYERWTSAVNRFRCTLCGRSLSVAIIAFYNGDVTRARCYDCQRKHGRG